MVVQIHSEYIPTALPHAPGSCPLACLWKTPASPPAADIAWGQLQKPREEGSAGKMLRSKDTAFGQGVFNQIPGGSIQDQIVFTACLEM